MTQKESTTYTALICAAGQGKRLRPMTDQCPKALLQVGEKTIVEHLLDNLSDCGLSDVVLLVGYKGDMIEQAIGNTYKHCSISYVYNTEYESTDNFYSLFLARDKVPGKMMFFNADIIFSKDILDAMLADRHENSFVVVRADSPGAGGNPVRVQLDEHGKLLDIGHEIGEENIQEVFGIYKLSAEAARRYFQSADVFFASGPRKGGFWLPIKQMAPELPLYAVFADDTKWASMNTADEYANAARLADGILGK